MPRSRVPSVDAAVPPLLRVMAQDVCKAKPKEGPAMMRRWYLALTNAPLAANDDVATDADRAAAAFLRSVCERCRNPCDLPLK